MKILRTITILALLSFGCASNTTAKGGETQTAQGPKKKKCVKKQVIGSRLTKTVCEGDAPDPTVVEMSGEEMEKELRRQPRPTKQ